MSMAPQLDLTPPPVARRSVSAARATCPVCHAGDVHFDEVFDGDVLHLAECGRCEHRWTSRTDPRPGVARRPAGRPRRPGARPVPRRAGDDRGVASAA